MAIFTASDNSFPFACTFPPLNLKYGSCLSCSDEVHFPHLCSKARKGENRGFAILFIERAHLKLFPCWLHSNCGEAMPLAGPPSRLTLCLRGDLNSSLFKSSPPPPPNQPTLPLPSLTLSAEFVHVLTVACKRAQLQHIGRCTFQMYLCTNNEQ